ncbi:MAG: hypothetical protein HFG33_01170 [Bacilli bacterium]|nr:hypothetical protein [Bacilli bacterium]
MNIRNNIINYLCDREYIVCMYDDCIYIFNYRYLDRFDDEKIVVSLCDRKITVNGEHLSIVRMTKEELLIRGKITSIEVNFKDEQG